MASAGRKKKIEWFDIVVYAFLTVFALLIIIPFYNMLLVSFAGERTNNANPGMLFLAPSDFTLVNYKYVFDAPILFSGYLSTLYIVGLGTVYAMVITLLTAYALSRTNYPGRKLFFALFALIPMYFGGGLIPAYLNIRDLGLLNQRIAIVLMGGVSCFNIIIIKSSIEQMPESMLEAAKIDGASELKIFFRIVLPLQLPIIATFSLFVAVGYWNEWFWPMMVLDKSDQWPLPLVLRAVVNSGVGNFNANVNMQGYKDLTSQVSGVGTQMATLFLTIAPIMIVYPFLQKYFVKGALVGAIKM